ncbi:MAG: isochorismate synthase, partial [Verrucomicrobia bacterium]|nr:isochorismate synthase [Verrucomicrobiota bacterium]
KEGVEKALQLIRRKVLEKVVLGRICILELAEAPDPFAIAAALKEKAHGGAFVFCAQSEAMSFLGASPERLFVRKGRALLSEAIAGTRPRGQTAAIDEQLRSELLNSSKDLREFSPVQKYLQSALSPLCVAPLIFSPISVHQTPNVQHLYSQCSGELKESITDEEILTSLHPTPALCGTPTLKAISLIRECEPFDRGLFGGAIGWSTPEHSEWIVGIRSCIIEGKKATLFSGTGIVEGSDPAEEWEELDHKLKLYDRILDD